MHEYLCYEKAFWLPRPEIKGWSGLATFVTNLCQSVGLWPLNDSVFLALKIRQGSRQIKMLPVATQCYGASRPQKWNLLNPVPKAPVRGKEAGTFVADGFITQKALQIHQGILGFWGSGSAAVKAPVVNGTTSIFLHLGCWCFCGRAGLRSAPDKTPPTQFSVSGKLILDEFPSQHSCPQASEGGGHRARSQVGTKQRGHTVSISHSPLSHLGRWQGSAQLTVRREGCRKAQEEVSGSPAGLSSFSEQHPTTEPPVTNPRGCHSGQPHLTAYKGFLSKATFHLY